MRLTSEEKKQLDALLAKLKESLLDELREIPAIRDGKCSVAVDDKFLESLSDAYFSKTEGLLELLIDSGHLNQASCPCVAVCTFSTR